MRLLVHDNYRTPFWTLKNLSRRYRLANVSDLHKYEGTPKKDLDRLKRSLLESDLDFACFNGDLIDKLNSFSKAGYREDTENFLRDIALKMPVGITFDWHDFQKFYGLHDERYDEKLFLEYVKMLESIDNVHVFKPGNNNRILLNNEVAIYGHSINPDLVHTYSEKDLESKIRFREDLANYYKNLDIDEKTFNVLYYHQAQVLFNKWKLASKEDLEIDKIDMFASGHVHGAMMPFQIPHCLRWMTLHRGGISPDKKLLPYYITGFYQENGLMADISSGMEKVPSTAPDSIKKLYKAIGPIVYSREYNISNIQSK